MTYQRLAYEDASTTSEMTSDCLVAEQNLAHHEQLSDLRSAESLASSDLPDYALPTAHPLAGITVPDSLAEMAAGLHLHFD